MKAARNNNALIENLEARTMMSASPLTVSEVAFNGGTQLRIIGTNGNDQITVTQTNAGLVLGNAGGWTKTVTDTINNLYINGQAGNNSIVLDSSVTINATIVGGGVNDNIVAGNGNNTLFTGTGKSTLQSRNGNDTLVSFGAKAATLVAGNGTDNFWADNSAAQKVVGKGTVHRVGTFVNSTGLTAGGKKVAAAAQTKTLNTTVKEPAVDAGVSYANFSNDPIFASTGPSADDIFQGNVGDCYLLSTLASVAKIDATRITNNILNMGDGTVVVQLEKNGKPTFVREDEQLPVNSDGSLAYAGLGQQNSTWVALFEKAYTYVRTSQTSYAAINSGWMDEAYAALGANATSTYSADNAAALTAIVNKDLAAGQSVTYATNGNPTSDALVSEHAYTVISATDTTVTLRNPWGCDVNGNGNGYLTITAAQAFKSMTGIAAANV